MYNTVIIVKITLLLWYLGKMTLSTLSKNKQEQLSLVPALLT